MEQGVESMSSGPVGGVVWLGADSPKSVLIRVNGDRDRARHGEEEEAEQGRSRSDNGARWIKASRRGGRLGWQQASRLPSSAGVPSAKPAGAQAWPVGVAGRGQWRSRGKRRKRGRNKAAAVVQSRRGGASGVGDRRGKGEVE